MPVADVADLSLLVPILEQLEPRHPLHLAKHAREHAVADRMVLHHAVLASKVQAEVVALDLDVARTQRRQAVRSLAGVHLGAGPERAGAQQHQGARLRLLERQARAGEVAAQRAAQDGKRRTEGEQAVELGA